MLQDENRDFLGLGYGFIKAGDRRNYLMSHPVGWRDRGSNNQKNSRRRGGAPERWRLDSKAARRRSRESTKRGGPDRARPGAEQERATQPRGRRISSRDRAQAGVSGSLDEPRRRART